MTEQLVGQLGYIGITLILVLGGLGLPIPEEAPIILAAVLSRGDKMFWPLAFATCLIGVLVGDFVVYFLGYFYGERVLSLPLTRRLLTREREAQIKGYFHRHGFKILVLGRFAVGFRTAAYLTAGILKLRPLKLFLTDLVAATLSTSLMFGLGYFFAHHIQSGIKEVQEWFMLMLGVGLAGWILFRFYKARRRSGLPIGPPVLVGELPLPPDDLTTFTVELKDEIKDKADSSREHSAPQTVAAARPQSRSTIVVKGAEPAAVSLVERESSPFHLEVQPSRPSVESPPV